MPEVLTLQEAKDHLRITTVQEDSDLQAKLDAATQIVIDYLQRRDTTWNDAMELWTSATVPTSVKHAILVQFGDLCQKRGDEPSIEAQAPITLSRTVMALLMRYREPGIA